ncbi:UDP-N-acetylmuramoyl-tripeptide--D-alanyl-D-alanine ligase [Gilvimarinus polysaccharolyticus]|uniref:UDP-N-acetylmuramoyl-tripeptide--D-alanyl-D- alanine ligase n=1 Tax=Gilvimarinus polysaccharolyticus TaxID=863921 RepID=UPI000673724C|nr:UDP-N-acetylmuramoyl-tripeptide--D-alanyl-D-alanine ligase [Gilvimarinus polysaccharolyticus]
MIGSMTIAQLQQDMAPQLKAIANGESHSFNCVCTDSRAVNAGDLFVALRGPHFDGHQYLADAQRAGAIGALVDSYEPACSLAQLQVADTTLGLGELARLNRERFTGPVVAITGSSGKTTVRTMVTGILRGEHDRAVLSTQGNFNNHIGVPLTLLRLNGDEECAVIEMGASAIGEIAYLCELARPDVALINNVMSAHLEGFGSLTGVADAKAEIYQGVALDGCCVINLDDPFAAGWLAQLHNRSHISFSLTNASADCYASDVESRGLTTYFNLHLRGRVLAISLPAVGLHNVSNALAAASCAHAVGASDAAITFGLNTFSPVPGRMNIKSGLNGVRVIDDSYNANPGSMRAAIDVLADMPGDRILVIGDMGELGADAHLLHAELGVYAASKKLDAVFSCGELAQVVSDNFVGVSKHFSTHKDLIAHLQAVTLGAGCTVLIKGSRSTQMDIVVRALTDEETQ